MLRISKVALVPIVAMLFFESKSASAQADQNAVMQATDAFGLRIGNEAVGLYNEGGVREFSLEAAGNYRVNGAYIVAPGEFTDRLIGDVAVKVGVNALNFAFPAPSGVVDRRLREATESGFKAHITVGLDQYASPYTENDFTWASKDQRISAAGGFGVGLDDNYPNGGDGFYYAFGFTPKIKLTSGITLTGLFSHIDYNNDSDFAFFSSDASLPPQVERRHYLGQEWANNKGNTDNFGALLDAQWGEGWEAHASAFFSEWNPSQNFFQVFTNVQPSGQANSLLIASPEQRFGAFSEEVRLGKKWHTGVLSHKILGALRLRQSMSRFGGDRVLDLGQTSILTPQRQITPYDFQFTDDRAVDKVNQITGGASYTLDWGRWAQFTAGLLKTRYAKTFTPIAGNRTANTSTPWLYNFGLVVAPTSSLYFYATYTKGLEEAGTAPDNAANINEVLPAIIATQREVGVRYSITPKLTLVTAGFDTRKPFAGLRPTDQIYTLIGTVRHRGFEVSLAGEILPHLNAIVGGVFLQPRVLGPEVTANRIARKPAGVVSRQINASFNYDAVWVPGLSFDLNITHFGPRTATTNVDPMRSGYNALTIPTRTVFDLGARYKLQFAKVPVTVRLQGVNLLNNYGWRADSSEALTYNRSRAVRFIATADF